MLNSRKRYVWVVVGVILFGLVRLPLEGGLRKEMENAGLMPAHLEVRTGERIGQTFSAVSLGGLRTLVATFLNLRAFEFFSRQQWSDVHETYETIVDLAPRTRYYWETGSWHQAYNAASYYLYGNSDLSPLRRKIAWRDSILTGRDFLERGVRNNPDDPVLYEALGRLYSDANKVYAFGEPADAYERAYDAFMKAKETGEAREYAERAALYSLARVPGREEEALELAESLRGRSSRVLPTLQGLLYSLRFHQNPERDVRELIDSVFSSREVAYRILGDQWLRTRDHFPMHGIAKAITLLEGELNVPEERSVFRIPLQSPVTPGEAFR